MNRLIFFFAINLFCLSIYAQTDNLFWFAAPDISSVHGSGEPEGGDGRPIYMHFTAVLPTTVTLSQPANSGFTPITFSLDALEHHTIKLSDIMDPSMIENYPQNLPLAPTDSIQKKAFLITAGPGEITCYYELDNYWNRDIFALKGRNGLGKNFYVSTQNFFDNGLYGGTAWSGFVVAATENNTRIVVYPNDDWLYPNPPIADSIVFYLDKGETFAFRAEERFANRHINGVRVKSDKKIAITGYDDSMAQAAGCRDTFGDQLVPISLFGREYLVMKGQLFANEKLFVTTLYPNTQIFVNGIFQETVPNAGEVRSYDVSTNTVYVNTSQPSMVVHITGYGCEMGGAYLPTIEGCTGSYSVTFTRTPNTLDSFFMNLMVRNDTTTGSPTKNQSVRNFTITCNSATDTIPENYFDFVLDSSWAVLKNTMEVRNYISNKITSGSEAMVSNKIARFHLGVINGGTTTGCKYGYFSDYASEKGSAGIGGAYAPKIYTLCSLDPVRLVATGGIAYQWTGISNPADTNNLSSTRVPDPIFAPDSAGLYSFQVYITRECFADTTLILKVYALAGPIALFNIQEKQGCSPFSPVFTNQTDPVRAETMEWNFDTRYNDWVDDATLSNPFTWPYPENNTDTVQEYTIKLLAKGIFGECPSSISKTIKVLPNVKAGFLADTVSGCHPLRVRFTDTTFGSLDTVKTYWDFVTNQMTYDSIISYTFNNFAENDTVYSVRLIAYSTYNCNDTATKDITVYPYINANYSISSIIDCSPFETTLNPVISTGVDTFFWNIYDLNRTIIDSSFIRTTENSFNFNHNDNTQPNPDTIFIAMNAVNDYGCRDTASTRRLIVYPEVHSLFDMVPDDICDSVKVDFTNNSIGYNLMFDWDFGDGISYTDTSKLPFTHRYFNRTDNDTNYIVKLITVSDYSCRDTITDTVIVHPYVKAIFGLEFLNNCSPLDAKLPNTSKGGDRFDWYFGDGTNDSVVYSTDTMYHHFVNPSNNDTTYYIKLVATNFELCKDSMTRPILLYPLVVAAYDFATPNTGCNPLTVDFINNSQGNNLTYLWNFDDGSTSSNPNPVNKVFENYTSSDKIFNVQLTTTNPYGCDSSITHDVTVYAHVDAKFTINRVDSCSPFKIRLNNDSQGGITDFIWKYTPDDSIVLNNFSDPDIPVYRNNGTTPDVYEIKLRALSANCEDIYIDTITVYPEIHSDFSPDTTRGCQPLNVAFSNNTNILANTSFYWDFGDGTYYIGANPVSHLYSHTSPNSKFYDATLEATSEYFCYDDTTIQIEVYPYIRAGFTINKPYICSDETFLIDRSGSGGGINEYFWDFNNDGIYDSNNSDVSFEHTFTNTGTSSLNNNIKLRVTNIQGCDTSDTGSILVHPQVRADFSIDDTEPCYPHLTALTNMSNDIGVVSTYFNWDFGDGSNSGETHPQHFYKNFSFTDDRQMTITLTATSDYGCDSTVSQNITIHPKPNAEFEFTGKSADCPPFTPVINNTSEGTNLTYNWTLENGSISSSTDFEPVSTFENVTNDILSNTITLITTTEFNCIDTTERILQVYPGVDADFTASPQWAGCDPLILDLDGLHNENAVNFMWDFDDGSLSTLENVQHLFTNDEAFDREYEVYFRAISAYGCEDDTVKIITVYPSPSPEFSPAPVLQEYDTVNDMTSVTFTNLTIHQDIWDYEWDFGDSVTSDNSNSSFVYTYGNLFWGEPVNNYAVPVTLYAVNRNNPECNSIISHDIVILPPRPQINIGEDVAGCVPLDVDFSATVKYTDNTYDWDFGYNNQTSTEAEPVFEYTEPGIYMVRLIVNGPGGVNVDFKEITVHPGPEVDFTFAPSEVLKESQTEPSEEIKFYNNTKFGEKYEWYYRYDPDYERMEEPFSIEKEPFLTLNDTGYYWVTLVAETSYGCRDSLIHPTPIYVKGIKEFEMPDYFYVNPDDIADGTYEQGVPLDGLFFPRSMGVEKYKFEIYNRWGELIFSTDNINTGWNGCIDNNPEHPVSQGVYVWKVKATFTNGQTKIYAGDVTLLINPERSTPEN
jgi:PKD repeat protein